MKVLMFGWEFPPNISGGLGTACYGLSKALVESGVGITFVVPILKGNEMKNGTTLLAANDFRAAALSVKGKGSPGPGKADGSVHKSLSLNTVYLPSNISPYNLSHLEIRETIQHWSYRFQSASTSNEDSFKEHIDGETGSKTRAHQQAPISGGYGADLIREVYQYAGFAELIAEKISFDIIHAHDWMTFPAAIAAKKNSGKPLVVHVHATEFDRAGEHGNPATYRLEKEGLREADTIIAVSQWTKNMLMSRYDIPGEKIRVVHNGIVPEDFTTEKKVHPLGERVVTFIGRVTYQKGPEYFVEAAELVLEKFPDAQFVVAGSGDMLPHIIMLVAKKKLSAHFSFTGFLEKEQINKLFSYSKVYVMPSVSEPFGIMPLEAIQAGVPVIISRQSGVKEVMPHALTVDFWDTAKLASAICSILEFDVLAAELKRNAQKQVDDITWDKAAQQLNLLYNELIN